MELAEAHAQFRKSLYLYIYSKINNKEDAEDILQNVFLKMTLNIQTLSDKEKIQNWLFRITKNTIIDYYRANANKKRTVELRDNQHNAISDDESHDNTKGLDKCLRGFIQQLPDAYKTIIIDSEIKGIPQKELSKKYGLAYPTLRSRVQRGRDRLRRLLTNCCTIASDSRGNIIESSRKGNHNGASCNACD